MMRAKYIASTLLAIALCVACDKEQPATTNESGEQGALTLTTRTTTNVDNFVNGSTLRLAIYESDNEEDQYSTIYLSEDYGDIYNDIYMKKASSEWSYSFDGGTSSNSKIGFIRDVDNKIDIVAAYPYISNEDLSNVSFSIATQTSSYNLGYMWAASDDVSLSEAEITADLHFQHIMSALNLAISTTNSTTGTTLQYVTLTLTDSNGEPKASIISGGTIDFFNGGELTSTSTVSSQAIYMNYGIYITTSSYYADRVIYLPPFEMDADDNLNIAFKIDGVDISESINLTGADFKYDNEDKYGFERGCKYTLTIVLDNYLKFSGSITKDDTWSDGGTTSTDV